MTVNEAEEKLLIVLKQVMEEKLTSINVEVCSVCACSYVLHCKRVLVWIRALCRICVCVNVHD